jgi:hypothetical protein
MDCATRVRVTSLPSAMKMVHRGVRRQWAKAWMKLNGFGEDHEAVCWPEFHSVSVREVPCQIYMPALFVCRHRSCGSSSPLCILLFPTCSLQAKRAGNSMVQVGERMACFCANTDKRAEYTTAACLPRSQSKCVVAHTQAVYVHEQQCGMLIRIPQRSAGRGRRRTVLTA